MYIYALQLRTFKLRPFTVGRWGGGRTSILYFGENQTQRNVHNGLMRGLELLGLYDYHGYNAYTLKPVLSGRNL